MVSTFTPNKSFEEPANGDDVGTWDVPVNGNMTIADRVLGGSTPLNATGVSGPVSLTAGQYQPGQLLVSGTPTGDTTYVIPSGVGGQWIFANGTSGGKTISIKSNAGGITISVPAAQATLVACDGSASGMRLANSTTPAAAGSSTQVQVNNGGILAADAGLTYDLTTGNFLVGKSATGTTTLFNPTIITPNGLNFDSNTLVLDAVNNRIGIGLTGPASPLTVAGQIESTATGVKYPDATVQSTAWLISTQNISSLPFVDFTGIPSNVNNLEVAFDLQLSANMQLVMQFYISGVLNTGASYFSTLIEADTSGLNSFVITGAASLGFGTYGTSLRASGRATVQNIQFVGTPQCVFAGAGNNGANLSIVSYNGSGGLSGAGGPITGVRITNNSALAMTGRVSLITTL